MADRLTVEELALIAERVMGWKRWEPTMPQAVYWGDDMYCVAAGGINHGQSRWSPQDSDADAMDVLRKSLALASLCGKASQPQETGVYSSTGLEWQR